MRILSHTYPCLILICLLLGLFMPSAAQDNTLYYLFNIPQAIHTNPAVQHRCRAYIELPVISSVKQAYNNTGFGYHDVIHPGEGRRADSLVIDVDNLARKLKNRNYIRNDLSVNLLGAGFALQDFYFHFNISDHTETRIGFPGDLVRIKDGNWDSEKEESRDIDLGGLGVTAISYLQFAAGASYPISSNLTAGVRIKYLQGSASLVNRRSNVDLYTESDPLVITGEIDYRLNASFPVDLSYDNQGFVEDANFDRAFSDPLNDYLFNKNRGGALDAGILYNYSDRITLAASVIDLGVIRWKSNVTRLNANGSFTFQGFDLREFTSSGDETDLFNALLDSIVDAFQFEGNVSPYFTLLTTKVYAGGYYALTDYLNVSVLGRTEIYDSRPHFSFTAAANLTPFEGLNATLSYSIMNNKLYQLGAGIGLGGKGFQFYIVSDHIPVRFVRVTGTPAVFPYNARTLNLRFGVNLIFGCDERSGGSSRRRGPSRNKHLCPAYW